MGKKSKKGTTKAGKGRPGAKAKQSSQGSVIVAPVPTTATKTTTAPVVNTVAVAPSVAAVPRTLVPSLVKDETLSPVSAADTADETVSYDGEGDPFGKPNAYLAVSEASLPDDIEASFGGENSVNMQKRPSVSFSDNVVVMESSDRSHCNIETSLPVEPTVTAQDDVLISESYDASRSVIEVCLATPEETPEATEPISENEIKQNESETGVAEQPTKNQVVIAEPGSVSLSSAKLDDILTETTEDFFASKESPLRKEFGNSNVQQNDDQIVASDATETEAGTSSVSSLLNMPGMEASFLKYADTFTASTGSVTEPEKAVTTPDAVAAPVIAKSTEPSPADAVEVGLDKVNVEKANVEAGSANTASAAEVPKSKDITTAVMPATTTSIDTSHVVSLTEPGPAETGEKQKECCIIL